MPKKQQIDLREIKIKGDESIIDSLYPGNRLKISRYTAFSLLPMNLFEQFHRISNIWFLIVAIFQLIPYQVNPTDSWTTILPLGILLSITLVKDIYTDYLLRSKDQKFNNLIYDVWDGEKFITSKSQDLLVGQFVLVKENQVVPADLVIVASTDEGSIFLDVTKLVGFTSLTRRSPVKNTQRIIGMNINNPLINRIHGKLFLTEPNSDYNSFSGAIKFNRVPGATELDISNILFRGGIFKGETAIIGLVAYCGQETKLQLNTKPLRKKSSKLEGVINTLVLYLLLVLSVVVFFSVIGFYFIGVDNVAKFNVIEPLITFTLLYNNIIPISLFVAIDLIRLAQGYSFTRKFKDIRFNTETVNENYGQVEYLITDKTGNLTENNLKLKMCVIDNMKFEDTPNHNESDGIITETNHCLDSTYRINMSAALPTNFQHLKMIVDNDMINGLASQFMKCMALCHDLYKHHDEYLGTNEEIALVDAANEFGYTLDFSEKNIYKLSIENTNEVYFRIVASRPFSKEKKRSRILLEDADGTGILYVKGKPEIILPLLNIAEGQKLFIIQTLENMSEKGLRTMVLAYKHIAYEDVLEIKSKIQRIRRSLLNPESRIETMFKELEKNLKYLGIAGLNEEIVPGSAKTISHLKEAGIKIWMTSSDSLNGSVIFAKNVGIIEPNSKTLELKNLKNEIICSKELIKGIKKYIFNEPDELYAQANQYRGGRRSRLDIDMLDDVPDENIERYGFRKTKNIPVFRTKSTDNKIDKILDKSFEPVDLDFNIIIDRSTLRAALKDMECRKMLTCLLICAKAVCFVDLMPRDKGNIVKLLKNNVKFKPLVAAVGSGEGDINMLQTSDVGIGISNGDDSLVLNYSDVVIKNFNQLETLLLVEGHWNYTRLSKVILLFLYKNCFLTIVLFAFTFMCNYSGTSIFNASLLLGFNLFFTSLPILVIGIFDEDTSIETIMKHRYIYSFGNGNMIFNWKKLCLYLGAGILQGILLVIFVFVCLPEIITPKGATEDIYFLGTTAYITLVLSVLIQIHLDTLCYNIVYWFSQLISIVLLIIFVSIISDTRIINTDLLSIGDFLIESPIAIITIIITSLACITPTYVIHIYYRLFKKINLNKLKSSYTVTEMIIQKLDNYKTSLGSLYQNTSDWKNKAMDEKFSMNKFTLKFNFSHIEKKFSENFIRENLTIFKWTATLLWILVILWTIFGAVIGESNLNYILSRIIITIAFSVGLFILWTDHFIKYYQSYVLLMIFLGLSAKFITEMIFSQTSILATALVPSVTFLIINVSWLGISFMNLLNLCLYIISISVNYYIQFPESEAALLAISSIIFIIAIILTSALVGYFLEKSKRHVHKLLNKAHGGVEQSQSILSIMLPQFVRNRVKLGERYIAMDQGEVTILFCDICDFDRICKEYTPNELTSFLDQIFSGFDSLCENIGVTKIETVGKTYMACSGLKDSEQDLQPALKNQPHARRAIELALLMIQEVNSIQLKYGSTLQVKIGINSGKVAAGVVGHHKPQFSLVGDTVNTASRMCSTLDSYNSIQISNSTYISLKSYADLEFNSRTVYAKGKGNITVYKVTEAKHDNSDVAGGFRTEPRISNNNMPSISSIFTEGPQEEIEQKPIQRPRDRASKLWINEIITRKDSQLIDYSPLLKITCMESIHEKTFRLKRLDQNYYSIILSLVIAVIIYFMMTILSIGDIFETNNTNITIIIGRSVVVVYLLVIIFLHSKLYKNIFYQYIIISCLILMTAIAMLNFSSDISIPADFIGLELMYIIVILNHACAASLPMVLFVNICIFIPWIVLSINNQSQSLNLTNALLVAGFSLINFKSIHNREETDRTNHNLDWLANKEITENDALLVQMMPPHVLDNLEHGKSITDKLMQVTLIFADIVGFTDWSSSKQPEEIVKMLSNLFTRFDNLCVDYDVYKVHTIGDCYVVMGDVGRKGRDPSKECLNVMKMANCMLEVIQEENLKHNSKLNMRIGVHTGEVIAGVIGTNIVRYDIWGPDVLIANKMESNGEAGRIKVSEDTKLMIENRTKHGFTFEESEKVEVPAIGVVKKSYYLASIDMDAVESID